MKNTTKPLLFTLLTTSLFFNFIGCQKQNIENTPQQTSTSQTNIAQENTINRHDYRIPFDKAVRFTKRYRDLIKDSPEEPIVYRVPADALRQLFERVDKRHINITHVSFYLSVNDEGHKTLIYVPTKDGTDIIGTPNPQKINGFDREDYNVSDDGGGCPSGGCLTTTPNALNGIK